MHTFYPEYTLNYSSLSEAVGIQRSITNHTDLHVYRRDYSLHVVFYDNKKKAVLNGLNYIYKLSAPSSFSFDIHLKNILPHIVQKVIRHVEEAKLDIEKRDRDTLRISGHTQYIDTLKVFDILYSQKSPYRSSGAYEYSAWFDPNTSTDTLLLI